MTRSMTGFAARTLNLGSASVAIEIKSVNQRYLEIGFRLPDTLRTLEFALRELIGKHLARGKVDCRINLTVEPAVSSHSGLNRVILERLRDWQAQVRESFPDAAPLNSADILRWPGLVQENELALDQLGTEILAEAERTLHDLVQTRQREGDKLREHILARLADAEASVATLQAVLPTLAQTLRDKLVERLSAALGDNAPDRLAQEVALFAQTMDIEEELARLVTHFSEVRRVLSARGIVGKRLDFLMQELHREANTLGSKSVTLQTSGVALELKVLIEQMREQVQNIE
jgi:uncharacterized protein (TIGR00255 family)